MFLLLYVMIGIIFSKALCENICDINSNWMRSSILDKNEKMVLKWNFTDDDITIMMMAKTKGWLMLGFSSRTSIIDVVLGWIKNNETYLQDRFMDNTGSEVIFDKIKSIELVAAEETETNTCICFRRKLMACDDQDYTITEGVTDVMWSFGKSDPSEENHQYKSGVNGHNGIHFLRVLYPKPSAKPYTLESPEKTVTSKQGTTLYWCSYHEIPPTDDQFYIVGTDSVIQKGNEDYVHHIVLESCNNEEMAKDYKTIDPQGYNCVIEENAKSYSYCKTVVAIWAVGVEDQYFPPSTGLPFGSKNSTTYYLLEMHYDLTMLKKEDFIDKSGITVYLTTEKPKNTLGIFYFEYQVSPLMIIPPGQKNFPVFGECDSSCLGQNIPEDGITIVAIYFHGHKLLRKMKLHIFRDNKELKPVVEDNYYFELQGFQFLKNKLKLLQNDTLGIECIYDTTEINETVVGDIQTEEEMCLLSILHYPPMNNLEYCGSHIKPKNLLPLIGLEEIGLPLGIQKCEGPDCQTPYGRISATAPIPVLKPTKYANQTLDAYLKSFNNWTSTNIETLKQLYLGNQNPVCSGNGRLYRSEVSEIVQYPSDASPYKSPNTCQN